MRLLYNSKEVEYQRRQFQETLEVQGIPARLYPVDRDGEEDVYDFYSDIKDKKLSYGEPVDIHILFHEVPSIKTLRSLGWYVEDDDLPYIAFLPVKYYDEDDETELIAPVVDDRIRLLENAIESVRSTREYLVKDIKSSGYPDTIYYTCKLVPYRENLS